MLSEREPGLSHTWMDRFARFRASVICLGDKLRGGTTANRAFKAVQPDWEAVFLLTNGLITQSSYSVAHSRPNELPRLSLTAIYQYLVPAKK